ncbi:MAG: hypothetical protein Q4F71_11510, partial [Paracoccus sp. (in: a-proteobacteria)]|nr:hypothetical protein [Paracoccus sp. (in: a-proteobacteria)]
MIRSFRNSTALVACLSVAVPMASSAEIRVPDNLAAEHSQERARIMPGMATVLNAELDAGLGEGDLLCLDGDERPCDDDVILVTPRGIAVEISESGEIFLADVADQPLRVGEGAVLEARPGNEAHAAALEAVQAGETPASAPSSVMAEARGGSDGAMSDALAALLPDAMTPPESANAAAEAEAEAAQAEAEAEAAAREAAEREEAERAAAEAEAEEAARQVAEREAAEREAAEAAEREAAEREAAEAEATAE